MARDIDARRTFTSMWDKLYFMCELSWEMLRTNMMSMNYRAFPDRIRTYFGGAVQAEKDLDHWHYDMMGQSMLIRNNEGDYSPAHRSLLEFFVAFKFAAELGIVADDFASLALESEGSGLGGEIGEAEKVQWSSFRDGDGQRSRRPHPIGFVPESSYQLSATFGAQPMSDTLASLMVPMMPIEGAIPRLLDVITGSETDSDDYVGGNAATLVARIDSRAMAGRDLRRVNLAEALLDVPDGLDLSNCDLRGAKVVGADLENVCFVGADLRDVEFRDARFLGLEKKYPATVAWIESAGNLFVGLGSGELLEWKGGRLSDSPCVLEKLEGRIFEVEPVGGYGVGLTFEGGAAYYRA